MQSARFVLEEETKKERNRRKTKGNLIILIRRVSVKIMVNRISIVQSTLFALQKETTDIQQHEI